MEIGGQDDTSRQSHHCGESARRLRAPGVLARFDQITKPLAKCALLMP